MYIDFIYQEKQYRKRFQETFRETFKIIAKIVRKLTLGPDNFSKTVKRAYLLT